MMPCARIQALAGGRGVELRGTLRATGPADAKEVKRRMIRFQPSSSSLPASTRSRSDSAPPWPHDPRDRVCATKLGEWEARLIPRADPIHRLLLEQGALHLQLWHPGSQLSVLAPCPTVRRAPAFLIDGWLIFSATEARVRAILARTCGLALPAQSSLEALVRWFVLREHRVARTTPRAKWVMGARSFEVAMRSEKQA
jgi:hypothetical protein